MNDVTLYEFDTESGPLQICRHREWVILSATEGTEEANMSFDSAQARGIAATLIMLAGEAEEA